ncbi:MAG TPA: hypothetical protein VMS17_18930 [Gemmataceae bacterium]|nr:hypothetical protein [Gemmataceae bacterium]
MYPSARCLLLLAGAVLVGSGRADDGEKYKYIPADADMVVSISIRRLVDSDVFQKYGKPGAVQGFQDPQVRLLLAALGLDPLRDVDSLVLSSSGDVADNPRVLLAVRGTFDVAKIHAAADLFAKANPAALKIDQTNGLTIYEGVKAGRTVYANLDASVMLASTDRDYLIQAVQNPSPGPSPAMKNALAKTPTDGEIAVSVVVTDAMKKRLSQSTWQGSKLAPKLEMITASVHVTKEVTTTVGICTTDAAAAADVKGMLDEHKSWLLGLPVFQPGPLGSLFLDVHHNITIARDGSSVQVSIRLTEDMLDKADKLKNDAKDKPDR